MSAQRFRLCMCCVKVPGHRQRPSAGTRGLENKAGKDKPNPSQASLSTRPWRAPRPAAPHPAPRGHSPSSSPWGWVSSAGAEASSEFRTEKICKETTITRGSEVSVHRGWTLRTAYPPRSTKPQPSTQHPSTQENRHAQHQTTPRGGGGNLGSPLSGRGWAAAMGVWGAGPDPCSAPGFWMEGWARDQGLDGAPRVSQHPGLLQGGGGGRVTDGIVGQGEAPEFRGRGMSQQTLYHLLRTLSRGHSLHWISWKVPFGCSGNQAPRSTRTISPQSATP